MRYLAIATAGALFAASSASATNFIEVEPNDSLATAQLLVHNGSISVLGFREAIAENTFTDFFRFEATAGDSLSLTVLALSGGDPVLRLFDSLGNILATDDDSGGFPTPLINFNVTQTGFYIGALRGFANSTYEYDFRVTGLTPSSAIPEPASWALMIGGFGLVGGALRRRAGKVRFAA